MSCKNLKGTNLWVSKVFSKKVLAEAKQHIPYTKEPRAKGQKENWMYNKLIINSETCPLDKSNQVPMDKEEYTKKYRTVSQNHQTELRNKQWERNYVKSLSPCTRQKANST